MKGLRYTAYGLLVALLLTAVGIGLLGWHEGYRAYAVKTGSMTPTYPTGALVVDRPADGRTPQVGQIITFRTTDGLVTHRVHGLKDDGIETKGDANRTPDAWTTPTRHVMGVVSWGAAYLGYVFVFFQQPTGALSLMLLTLSLYLAWTVFFPATEGNPVAQEASEPNGLGNHVGLRPTFIVLPGAESAGVDELQQVGPTRGQHSRSGLLSA
jgi:signal peptidase I